MAQGDINISKLVSNIKKTNVYTPLIEAIVNAIHSIQTTKKNDGEIRVKIIRSNQGNLGLSGTDGLRDIVGFEIQDNGIGFNSDNLSSWKYLYSPYKEAIGGKGFGRFTYLKYFNNISIVSSYDEEGKLNKINFNFSERDFTENCENIDDGTKTIGTSLVLNNLKLTYIEALNVKSKTVETLSRKILEQLLVYFIDSNFNIRIMVSDGSKSITLNDLFNDTKEIIKICDENFELTNQEKIEKFNIKLFKVYFSTDANSINLCADSRVVTQTPISNYFKDFSDPFKDTNGEDIKNYRIKAYVTGEYLNRHVDTERGSFNFFLDQEIFSDFLQEKDIEIEVTNKIKFIFKDYIDSLKGFKYEKIEKFIKQKAPYYNDLVKYIDLDKIPVRISDDELENSLHKIKYEKEKEIKILYNKTLSDNQSIKETDINELLQSITEITKTDLARYVINRKLIIDLFRTRLEWTNSDDRKFNLEKDIHQIIFPLKKTSETCSYYEHNLWLIDEKLSFNEYLTSDLPLAEDKSRPDILMFDMPIAVRAGDEVSNPVTIFEFKRPQRDEYTENDNPITQILEYVEKLKTGKIPNKNGRPLNIKDNTPVYAYLICDITPKIERFCKLGSFKITPDNKGYFRYNEPLCTYVEVISFDKLITDAEMRNKIFFHKLGLTK